MSSKKLNTKDLKRSLSEFFNKMEAAVCRSREEANEAMAELFARTARNRMVDGTILKVDRALDEAAENIVKHICRSLGPLGDDEDYISNMLWKRGVARITGDHAVAEHVDDFLARIEEHAASPRRYTHGTQLLRLGSDVDHFQVGPIAIVDGEWLANDLRSRFSNEFYRIAIGELGMHLSPEGSSFTIGIGQHNWDIEVVAATVNLAEEAAWLAGIAVSLLRLTTWQTLGDFVPKNGQVEPHVFRSARSDHTGIIVTADGISTGGRTVSPTYVISPETLAYCAEPKFQTIATSIFSPKEKTVGERLKQSLGWQARGRQSDDRAERMLYFFTSMEAMLSSSDKSVPVVQTIARNAASILTNVPDERASCAKLIKDLYVVRSALVHAGTRKATKRQANTIEEIAERTCWQIMNQVDLNQSIDQFQADLSRASYGLSWGDQTVNLLPGPVHPKAVEKEE